MKDKNYIPALRFGFLTRFYDPIVRATTRESAFKRALLAQSDLSEHQTILDLACGTGTLSIEIKRRYSGAQIFAVDADRKILEMARAKARAIGAEINFEQSFSEKLAFADASFDRVFSTLFFHHLTLDAKIKTLREILRTLKPGGEFHLADYALPRNKAQFILSKSIRFIDGFETTRDNLRGRLIFLMKQSGFAEIEKTGYFKTILGTIRLFKAVKK